MTRGARAALLVGWVGAIALLGYYVQQNLHDQRRSAAVHAVAQDAHSRSCCSRKSARARLRACCSSRSKARRRKRSPRARRHSRQRCARIRSSGSCRTERLPLDAIPEALLPYRYLLSSTLDHHALDAAYLREQLERAARGSVVTRGGVLEPLIPRDPTLEVLKLAEQWQPAKQPQRQYDVWFDSKGDSAILVVATKAAAFDPEGQEQASQRAQQKHFEETRGEHTVRMTVSGPGAFSVLMKGRTQAEATLHRHHRQHRAHRAAVHCVSQSDHVVVLGALPLASAGVAGLAVVSAVFGSVHGITLAFGFTLIGVAQDYPIHLFSHQHPGKTAAARRRAVGVAHAGDGRGEHVHRVSRVPAFGRHRAGAARVLHDRGARRCGAHHALSVAAR